MVESEPALGRALRLYAHGNRLGGDLNTRQIDSKSYALAAALDGSSSSKPQSSRSAWPTKNRKLRTPLWGSYWSQETNFFLGLGLAFLPLFGVICHNIRSSHSVNDVPCLCIVPSRCIKGCSRAKRISRPQTGNSHRQASVHPWRSEKWRFNRKMKTKV